MMKNEEEGTGDDDGRDDQNHDQNRFSANDGADWVFVYVSS